jgi:cellobiose transport system permease protein
MIYLLGKAPQGGNAYGYAAAVAYVITFMIIVFTIILTNLMGEREPVQKGK